MILNHGQDARATRRSRNWLRFARFALGRPQGWRPAAGLYPIRNPQSRNWVRFARFAPGRQPGCPKLGSFCTFTPRPTPLGSRPTRPRRELGSFCTIGIGLEWRNNGIVECWGISSGGNWVCFAHFALRRVEATGRRAGVAPQVRSQSAIRNPQSRNWLRFAQFTPGRRPGCPKLGLFCTFAPRPTRPRRELGSFCAFRSPQSCPTGEIGFVSHARLSDVRLETSPIGFVSHKSSPPRHREPAPAQAGGHRTRAGRTPAPGGLPLSLTAGGGCPTTLGVSVVKSSHLAEEQNAAFPWSRQTRRVPDPAHRGGRLRGRPYLIL